MDVKLDPNTVNGPLRNALATIWSEEKISATLAAIGPSTAEEILGLFTGKAKSIVKKLLQRLAGGDVVIGGELFKPGHHTAALPLLYTPGRNARYLRAPLADNTAFPQLDVCRRCYTVSKSPVETTIALPGEWELQVKLCKSEETNAHFVNSLAKSLLTEVAFHLYADGYTVRDYGHSWLGDHIAQVSRGTILFAMHEDGEINEDLVRCVIARKIPLLAVISADPECPYHYGGIDYEYDANHRIYRGHSAGRADSFVYKASSYAKFYRYQGVDYSMGTVACVGAERIVIFDN